VTIDASIDLLELPVELQAEVRVLTVESAALHEALGWLRELRHLKTLCLNGRRNDFL